jgi:biopolymer transport protein ExbD
VALSASSPQGPAKADINVTPMIDVMLVLLIIFMIVTPAIAKGFQASVPRAANADKHPEDNGEIRLGIDQNGKFYIDMMGPNGVYTGMRLISDADLPNQLMAIYGARSVDKILFLKSDANVQFARVQEAIEIARKSGVRVIAAIAEQQRTKDKK